MKTFSVKRIEYSLRKNLKLFLLFLTLNTYFLILVPTLTPTHAQTNDQGTVKSEEKIIQNQTPLPSSLQTPYYSPNSPHTASLAIYNFSHAISCILIGQSPIAPCLEYQLQKDATGMIRSVPVLSSVNTSNGVLGVSLSMLDQVAMAKPIQTSEFITNIGEQIGVKSANAQVGGSGSGVLSPVFKLWEVSRNIAYLAMIIIFVLVGLMVMFRQRLNPQTVVSIQMALPGLVIGLVMITFSYFLASLVSDLAFVGTNVVGYFFTTAQGPTAPTAPLVDRMAESNTNVLFSFSKYAGIVGQPEVYGGLRTVTTNLSPYARGIVDLFAGLITAQFTLPVAGAITTWKPPLGFFASMAIPLMAGLAGALPLSQETMFAWVVAAIATIVLIYSMFKLLLKLINNILSIIFLTITAPFHFLLASLPGRQNVATGWFLNMLCNVLAFPAVIAVFYFVGFLLPDVESPPFSVPGAIPLTGTQTFPFLGGLDIKFINILLAFGALVATPSIPDIICRVIGKPSPAGQMANQEISADIRAGQGYYNQQFGAIRSLGATYKRTIYGDKTYARNPEGPGWVTHTTSPSLMGWFRGERPAREGSHGAGGTSVTGSRTTTGAAED